jgi:hypothetical protein
MSRKNYNSWLEEEGCGNDSVCVNMQAVIDRAERLGFQTLCDYVEYLEHINKTLRNYVHAQEFKIDDKK